MKKTMTIEERIAELEAQKERIEAFGRVINSVDNMIENLMTPEVETETWKETYIDEETGEEKTRWHWETYKKDEDGNTIYHEPSEDSYNYKEYVALKRVRDEIMQMI